MNTDPEDGISPPDLYRHLDPRLANRVHGREEGSSYVEGSWDDLTRPPRRIVRGGRASSPNLLAVLAWAEIMWLDPAVAWTKLRSKERVRIDPWRHGIESARAFLFELAALPPSNGGKVGQQYIARIEINWPYSWEPWIKP